MACQTTTTAGSLSSGALDGAGGDAGDLSRSRRRRRLRRRRAARPRWPDPACRTPFEARVPFDPRRCPLPWPPNSATPDKRRLTTFWVPEGISRWALTLRRVDAISTDGLPSSPPDLRPTCPARRRSGRSLLLDDKPGSGDTNCGRGGDRRAEVIVSAGVIHSPAILLRRSGIGDSLPVGSNLKDHATTAGFEVALSPECRMASPNDQR